jgi:hypothetical protein
MSSAATLGQGGQQRHGGLGRACQGLVVVDGEGLIQVLLLLLLVVMFPLEVQGQNL